MGVPAPCTVILRNVMFEMSAPSTDSIAIAVKRRDAVGSKAAGLLEDGIHEIGRCFRIEALVM